MAELELQVSPNRSQRAVAEPHPNAPDASDGHAERRDDPRRPGPRQVWIQGTDANGDNVEEVQMMRNYSRGGFYFITHLHCYRVGMHLTVIPSFGSLNMEYVAEIVRVEPKARMAYGVGVKLLHIREPITRLDRT